MRTISTTLAAARLTAACRPALKLTAANRRYGLPNLSFERIYSGPEAEYYHCLAAAGDGSLIRARISLPENGRRLFVQRVADPAAGAGFDDWADSGFYNVVSVALGAGAGAVHLGWVLSDRRVEMMSSLDNGVTFGPSQLVDYTPTTAINGLSLACRPDGGIALFIADQQTLYVKEYRGGQWLPRQAWDKTTGTLSGVAACYGGDYNLFVSGQNAAGRFCLWSLLLGDGQALPAGEWSSLFEVAAAPAGAGYAYRHAFLAAPDVLRAFFVEQPVGPAAASRVYRAHTLDGTAPAANRWVEAEPFAAEVPYGLAVAHHADRLWVSSAGGVWQASLAPATVDLSAKVISLTQATAARSGLLEVELLADSALDVVEEGWEVSLANGYYTAAGPERGAGLTFSLAAEGTVIARGNGLVILRAADGWANLHRWRARHQFRWNAAAAESSVLEILAFILARAGLNLEVVSSSDDIRASYPDFGIPAGGDGLAAVERLLGLVPDELFIESATAFLICLSQDDAPVYSYARGDAAACRREAKPGLINSVQCEGRTAGGEMFTAGSRHWPSVEREGERWLRLEDAGLTTPEAALALTGSILAKQRRRAASGRLTILPNPAHQLYDVVDITGEAGETDRFRIAGWKLEYRPRQGIYRQNLVLGGV